MTLRIAVGHGALEVAANQPPNAPTITAGTPSSTGVSLSGSTFSDDDSGDTHANSYWDVATDSNFATIVATSGKTSTYLTSWNATGLSPETLHYARVLYYDNHDAASPWSTATSFTTAATPVVGAEAFDVAVTRLTSGTGSGLCSTGIPLPPGVLFIGDEAKVRVIIGGTEQSIYVESLTGRHSDNSVRSILVQFNISCNYGSPLTGTVEAGSGVTRSTTDISKTAITWSTPTIACLPTDPAYLISCELCLPTIPVADVPVSPSYLTQYETEFVTYGDIHWNAEYPAANGDWSIVNNFYDRALVWYTWWVRTGTFEYWRRGTLQAVEAVSYMSGSYWPPRNQQLEGFALHHLLTGYAGTYNEVIAQAGWNYLIWTPDLSMATGDEYVEGRIQERTLMSHLLAWGLGDTSEDWASIVEADLTGILASQDAVTGAYDNWINTDHTPDKHVPYMTGLVHAAFIKYYNWYDADVRIPPAIKAALDHEWDNLWTPAYYSFIYQTGTSPSVDYSDTNLLSLGGYSWYYWYSSDNTYLTRAETIMQYGVEHAWLGGANTGHKQFNQNYRQSSPHMYWRLGQ